jgi:HD superfamily phosphohydrolase YqeK
MYTHVKFQSLILKRKTNKQANKQKHACVVNAKRSYLTLQHCSFIPPTSRKLISPNQWMHQYVAYLAATTHDQKKILPKYFVLPKTISAKFKNYPKIL